MAKSKFTRRLTARVSEEEFTKVQSKIAGSNITQSEWLRKAVLANKSEIRQVDKEFQKQILWLLSNIANNCNQVAHHCNIKKRVDREALERLDEILSLAKSVVKEAK